MFWRIDEGGAGRMVDEGGGKIFLESVELLVVGAGGENGVVVGGEFFGDLTDLVGGFAGAEDDLRMTAAQGAMVVEGGKGKLLKGKRAEAGEGFGNRGFAFGDVGEEGFELIGGHRGILAWGEGKRD